MMFDVFKKFVDDATKASLYNFIITLAIVSLFSILSTSLFIYKLSDEYKTVSSQIYQAIIDKNTDNIHYFISKNNIIIQYDGIDKVYKIKNKKISDVESFPVRKTLSVGIKENISIEFPNFLVYNYGDVKIKIGITYLVFFLFSIFSPVILAVIILNIAYSISLRKNTSKMKVLKVSAQEYALSQRTTSYLVSIIHHKLNTPLKTLSTKSRMLVKLINTYDAHIETKALKKAQTDYESLDNAIKVIKNVTKKLKEYNNLSQNESNIYKLFSIAKETIDILRDDSFDIKIDYKMKLYDIDKTCISSHEIIQIFINQIKFSLTQLADEIGLQIFSQDNDSITVLYSDNGNKIDQKLEKMISKQLNVAEITNLDSDYYDLLLNFNILNENGETSIRLLSSNPNGNIFHIKLPTFKHITSSQKDQLK